eukprot:TRINITY_DN13864_c0_g1_i1.p1 TRINITY_DN13864_c0_g1~~TRINITY_DN13864_c0_g1_i1.p1  ORF type:complete len:372 (+),score=136.72 TRINITY_DN13864_c0_g1_i1:44-1117(+)
MNEESIEDVFERLFKEKLANGELESYIIEIIEKIQFKNTGVKGGSMKFPKLRSLKTDERLFIDVAKTNISKCQFCNELIDKGDLRIVITSLKFLSDENKQETSTQKCHFDCYAKQNAIVVDNLIDFEKLPTDLQERVRKSTTFVERLEKKSTHSPLKKPPVFEEPSTLKNKDRNDNLKIEDQKPFPQDEEEEEEDEEHEVESDNDDEEQLEEEIEEDTDNNNIEEVENVISDEVSDSAGQIPNETSNKFLKTTIVIPSEDEINEFLKTVTNSDLTRELGLNRRPLKGSRHAKAYDILFHRKNGVPSVCSKCGKGKLKYSEEKKCFICSGYFDNAFRNCKGCFKVNEISFEPWVYPSS